MSAIELGDVTAGPAPEPEPPIYSRDLVRATMALVTVLGLAAVAGSARPEPSLLLRPLWSIGTTDPSPFSIDRDTVFVLNSGWDLTAYALADGRERWTVRLPAPATATTVEDLTSLLLPSGYVQVTREDPEKLASLDSATAQTVALDPATGAERWRATGGVGYRDAATALLVEADPHGGRPKAFRAVRIADGTVLWTRAAAHPDFWIAGGGHLVTVAADGRTDVIGLADGTATDGHDLATGARRWRAAGWVNAAPTTGGRLLAEKAPSTGEGLLDAATGALLADLGAGYPVWNPLDGTAAFLLRDTVAPPGRTAVFRLDDRTGGPHLRGSIGGLPIRTCMAAVDRLICKTADGRLRVVAVG